MHFVQNEVFIAILAHGLIGASLVWDKVLLRRADTKNLVFYVFWLGALSVFGLALIPFGFRMPSWTTSLLATAAGALHLVAVYSYYAALKSGEASQALAIMGGFSPGTTALIGTVLLAQPLGRHGLAGFILLTGGGFVMFLTDRL